MKIAGYLIVVCLIAGCNLGNLRGDKPSGPREVDVPVSARDDDGPRLRILVLPFLDNNPDRLHTVDEDAHRYFVNNLNQTRRFVVLNEQDLPQNPLKLHDDQGDYDLEGISKLAQPLSASAVVEGKVIEVQVHRSGDSFGLIRKSRAKISANVRLRVYAARNGKELLNQSRTVEIEDVATHVGDAPGVLAEGDPMLIRQAVRAAFDAGMASATQVLEKMNWEGRVAMVNGERVFLNAGRLSGLQVGDVLKVTEEGNEVFDPQTGHFIGKAPGRVKGTIEVVSYFGKDGAIAVVHSGSGFQENDHVELY